MQSRFRIVEKRPYEMDSYDQEDYWSVWQIAHLMHRLVYFRKIKISWKNYG